MLMLENFLKRWSEDEEKRKRDDSFVCQMYLSEQRPSLVIRAGVGTNPAVPSLADTTCAKLALTESILYALPAELLRNIFYCRI